MDFNNASHLFQATFVILAVVIFFQGFRAGDRVL